MQQGGTPISDLSFLARSETRVRIVEQLLSSAPATQRDLRVELDASRSTVARSLSALEDRGWVTDESGSYALTPVGAPIAETFLDAVDAVRATNEVAPFLRWFPLGEYDIGVEDVRDGSLTVSTDGDPYAPARRQTELLRAASQFRGFLPSIDLEGTELVHEQVLEQDLEAEIVVSPGVAETISSEEFAPLFREKLATGRLTVLVADDPVSFYVGLAGDRTVHVGVEDDDGFPRALLNADGGRVREWAESLYEDLRASASTLDDLE